MPNGLRYWLVGGVDSTRKQKKLEARKLLENAPTPTSPVHALLGGVSKIFPKAGGYIIIITFQAYRVFTIGIGFWITMFIIADMFPAIRRIHAAR